MGPDTNLNGQRDYQQIIPTPTIQQNINGSYCMKAGGYTRFPWWMLLDFVNKVSELL